MAEGFTPDSDLRAAALEARQSLGRPAGTVVASGGRLQEYLHNHSLVNQIITRNESPDDFFIVMDYTSDGPLADRHKEVVRVTAGGNTLSPGDTDMILPRDRDTRFMLPDGTISPPGYGIRTSGKGEVTITKVDDDLYSIEFERGLTPGSVSVMQNPDDDPESPFRGADGMDAWRRNF